MIVAWQVGRGFARYALRVSSVAGALVLLAREMPAQVVRPMAQVSPEGIPLRMLAERRFDRGAGLRSANMYAMAADADGQMWLAAEDGVYQYTAGTWRSASLPVALADQQVRALLFDGQGSRWMGTRRGVVRARIGGPMQHLTEADGLPGAVVYSLAETPAIDGTPRVVAGTSNGVAWFNGSKFVPLVLPPRISPLGMMVRATRGRDSVPELWIASSLGGVARLKGETWTTYTAAEGLQSSDAQFILDARSSASGLFVAASDGVFVLDSAEQRFARIPGSPARAFRLAVVPTTNGTTSLWVGTTDGRLYEWLGGDVWKDLPRSVADRRGAITLLHSVSRLGGGTSVYLSARGSYLSRISIGAAATLDLLPDDVEDAVFGVFARPTEIGRDELWLRTLRTGLVHVTASGVVQKFTRKTGAPFDTVRDVRAASTDGVLSAGRSPSPAHIVVASREGVFAYRGGSSFSALTDGLNGRVVFRIRRVVLPDGRNALVAATNDGLLKWNGNRWLPSGLPVNGAVNSILDGDGVLYLGGAHIVRRVTASQSVDEKLPDTGGRAIGTGVVSAICRATVGSEAFLFAHDTERGVFWRAEKGSSEWALMPPNLLRSIGSLGPTSVECRSSRVLVSTLSGLVVIDISKRLPSEWSVATQLSQADGLPSSEVSGVASSGEANLMWVSTSAGVGLVDVAAATRRLPAQLALRVTSEGSGRAIADGLALDQDENDLHVEPMLSTYHREEETRYRVRLHRREGWFGGRGEIDRSGRDVASSRDSSAFLDVPNRYYLDLEAGEYDLDAWAYDWAGREYGPVRRTFTVRTAAWRTWYALALYAALGALIAIAGFRWRVNMIRSNGLQLLDSERRLRESERKFRTIFDRAMDAHLLLGDGRVVAANARAAELFGVPTPDQLDGRPVSELLALTDDNGAGTPPPQEFAISRGDAHVPVQCTVTTVPNEGSVLRHMVLRDLTSVRQAEAEKTWFEAQVREAQKLESLGTLAGGVAHDFNNLLGVIRGNAELAKSALRKGRSNEENLGAILDASDRARDVVRQILTFSRRSTPTREYVNLSRLVVDLQPLLRRMIPRTVSLIIDGADQPQLIMGDPTQLQQLLLNLVSNAEYAMRAKTDGVLTIALSSRDVPATSAEPNGPVVVLQVRDTGEGMTAEVRNRIFEPFFTTKPTGEGTGLGMAVLHGIVVSHHGQADVISEPGRGTTFELRFPLAVIEGLWDKELSAEKMMSDDTRSDDAESEASLSPVAYGSESDDDEPDVLEQSPYAGSCLVVVDDEPGVARVVERALQHYGHVVHVFAQPELALEFIQRQPSAVDLLISDQTMPVMTGDMLAEAVHKLRPDLPVLILTGFSHRLTPERIAAARAQAVLLKPVALDDLRRAVDAALSRIKPAASAS